MQKTNEEINVNLVIVGDGAVGKTCVLVSYTTDKFPTDYVPTIFENYATHLIVDGKMINLNLWDTAGQEAFSNLRSLSYGQADAFLITFDITQNHTFENALKLWFTELQSEELKKKPKIFIGNKVDIRDKNSVNYDLQINELKCQYFECSAKSQQGLKIIFEEAVRKVIQQKSYSEPKVITELKQTQSPTKKPYKVDEREKDPPKECCQIM